jgi:hypothetical protein
MPRKPNVCHWTRCTPILIAVLASYYGRCTTVLMYRNSTRIVVGADTLSRHENPSTGAETSSSYCKIRKTGTIYVSMAGYTSARSGFDAYSLASKAINHSNGVVESAKQFAKLSIGLFTDAVSYQRRHHPDSYKRNTKRGGSEALSVIFMGFENFVPSFATVVFTISETSPETMSVKASLDFCPGHACPPRAGLVFRAMGVHEAIERNAQDRPSFPTDLQNDPASTIRRLIELETREAPDEVGLPIDILTISKDGATWNARGVCH